MKNFELTILGCGSAMPTTRHYPSSQVLSYGEKLFMIDCGEGAQLQFRRNRLKFSKLHHIFISHLHGDHCFGLIGLISTLGILGRTGELVIHINSEAERIFRPHLDFFCRELPFEVRFEPLPRKHEVIYEDRTMRVSSLPLKHRIQSCGFLFEEKEKQRHLIGDMVKFYNIPIKELAGIKSGADFITPEGTIIPNERLTRPADPISRYAYCSDTTYLEKLIPMIEGVDLLYHEATFAEDNKVRAKETFHSTAIQAATIAQKAHVKKLLLGHFSARYEEDSIFLKEAEQIFPNTILAKEGLHINI
ncbi:MAG: ribonuclease Z [Tannerella sp.]|uniref:ribonuclease Z n=1 Tax=Coprobacter fastidiosus TaxID=1099853 RepID=UPI0026111CAF|nr:ribonuclease Z [Coprobacter fastidiosus]MBS6267904.1 ribonuclease Z [Tannerella sp.]